MTAWLGANPAEVERNAALLRCWDWLSLFMCTGADAEGSFGGVPGGHDTVDMVVRWTDSARTEAALEPWPFSGEALDLPVEARLLDGTFPDQAALDAALAAAPREQLRLVLRPE
jgi:hypothetical protein